jgi:hypothetical protein
MEVCGPKPRLYVARNLGISLEPGGRPLDSGPTAFLCKTRVTPSGIYPAFREACRSRMKPTTMTTFHTARTTEMRPRSTMGHNG